MFSWLDGCIFNSFSTCFFPSVFTSLQGYVVRISGGNDKQGFPMKQGVLSTGRVRLLLSKGHSCYRPRRTGERKRKSVRGCIVDANLSVLNLVIVRKGMVIAQATLPPSPLLFAGQGGCEGLIVCWMLKWS